MTICNIQDYCESDVKWWCEIVLYYLNGEQKVMGVGILKLAAKVPRAGTSALPSMVVKHPRREFSHVQLVCLSFTTFITRPEMDEYQALGLNCYLTPLPPLPLYRFPLLSPEWYLIEWHAADSESVCYASCIEWRDGMPLKVNQLLYRIINRNENIEIWKEKKK